MKSPLTLSFPLNSPMTGVRCKMNFDIQTLHRLLVPVALENISPDVHFKLPAPSFFRDDTGPLLSLPHRITPTSQERRKSPQCIYYLLLKHLSSSSQGGEIQA